MKVDWVLEVGLHVLSSEIPFRFSAFLDFLEKMEDSIIEVDEDTTKIQTIRTSKEREKVTDVYLPTRHQLFFRFVVVSRDMAQLPYGNRELNDGMSQIFLLYQ